MFSNNINLKATEIFHWPGKPMSKLISLEERMKNIMPK